MKRTALAILVSLVATGAAHSATTGFTLNISGDTNVPTLQLTNDSTSALLTGFNLSIGNTAFNFDAAYFVVPGTVDRWTLVSPDANDGGVTRTDLLQFTFAGFDPGEVFQFRADVDRDSSNTTENYRTVLFNNGSAPNAVATAFFSDGKTLMATFPDASATQTSFTISASQGVGVVPLPAGLPLLLAGLGTLALIRARRKTA